MSMPNTLDLHERPVQDDIIRLLRSELGYTYLGRWDQETQMFDAAGHIQSHMVGQTVKIMHTNLLM